MSRWPERYGLQPASVSKQQASSVTSAGQTSFVTSARQTSFATNCQAYQLCNRARLESSANAKQASFVTSANQAGFVTGHDFSRAEKPTKRNWALAPEGSKNMEMHTALRIKTTEKTRS
jgi:hypothetical protein